MNYNRIAMSSVLLALGLSFGASASAQTGLTASPNPLNMSAPGGGYTTGFITVTNHGPGFASNLAVAAPTNLGPKHGALSVIADTCTGATLAQNGTCTVRFSYEAPCFVRAGYQDQWYIAITSVQFPAMNEHVIGTNLSNACI
jgi:hypothetical protein